MANTSLRGFRWVRSLVSDQTSPTVVRVRLSSGYTPQIGGAGTYNLKAGDPVTQRSTGYYTASIGSEGSHDKIAGVIAGFAPIYNSAKGYQEMLKEFPGGGGVYGSNLSLMTYAYMIPVKDQVFEVDADDGAAANDTEAEWIALVGQNADHVLTAGSTPDLNPLLDISSASTDQDFQWRILDVAPRIDNDLTVTRAKVQVTCNLIDGPAQPTNVTIADAT